MDCLLNVVVRMAESGAALLRAVAYVSLFIELVEDAVDVAVTFTGLIGEITVEVDE